jgi:alpha-N-arabinofuranosidase
MVFLGIRPQEENFYEHLGRETVLTPVRWSADGWPEPAPAELEFDAPGPAPHPWPAAPARDDFSSGKLGPAWNFLRNPDPRDWSLAARPGFLRLNGSERTLNECASPAFVGRRQEHLVCEAAARLEFDPAADGEEAGLTVLMNERHHYEIFVTRRAGRRVAAVRRRIGDLTTEAASAPAGEGPVELRVRATAAAWSFSFKGAAGPEQTLAEGSTRYLSKEVAGGFTGVYLGLYAAGSGRRSAAPADFDWFDYVPGPPNESTGRP